MIKSLKVLSIAAVAAAAALAAPAVHADTVVLKAHVPFSFVVGERQLPSGEYRFVQGEEPGVVHIYSSARRHLAIALCEPVRATASDSVRLVFSRYGDQRFLKMIRTGERSGVFFPKTRAELRAATGGTATAAVGME